MGGGPGPAIMYAAQAAIKQEEDAVTVSRTDKKPASLTHYLKVSIGEKGAAPMMGVFVPEKYKPASDVDLILYFHGHKWTEESGKQVWHTDWGIDQIWSHSTFPLREGLNASGRQLILVAPTLGATDQFGDWGTSGDQHLKEVMIGLNKFGPHINQPRPKIASIILAGHSGAYKPMWSVANNLKAKDKIKEVWGFDMMYGHVDGWANWARGRGDVKFYSYFVDEGDHMTKTNSINLARQTASLDNMFIMKSADYVLDGGKEKEVLVTHPYIVQRFWSERLQRVAWSGGHADDQARRDRTRNQAAAPAPRKHGK